MTRKIYDISSQILTEWSRKVSADYKPRSRNSTPRLHKTSKLHYDGDTTPAQHHFKIMGFGDAVIPESLTPTNIRRLAGNMMAVPVIGAVFSVMLHHIKLAGEDDDSSID